MSRRMPFLDVVSAFEVAARHLGFSHAANKLGVTQGTISRMNMAPVGRSPRKDLEIVEEGSGVRADLVAPDVIIPLCIPELCDRSPILNEMEHLRQHTLFLTSKFLTSNRPNG